MTRSTVADFSIEHVQVLDEDGNVDEDLEPDIPESELLTMYRTMKQSRRFDERAISLQRRGDVGTVAPVIGQEAAQVGSARALTDSDWMVPSFREQAAYLARGTPMSALFEYAMGMEEGCEVPDDQHDFPPSIPVGSQALHAAGLGWAQEITGEEAAALVYHGDGATSQGDVNEALNMAGVFDAHCVFLCQNNQWAISVPRKKQSKAETLAQKAIAAGIDGIQVDGNDVLGTYLVASEALEQARAGEPMFVEAMTYRQSMHTTSDDPSVYRSEEEEEGWVEYDPIDRFETYLRDRDILDDDRIDEIEREIDEEVEEELEHAREQREAVDPEDMFRYVFDSIPPYLERQVETYRKYAEADRGPQDGLSGSEHETQGEVANDD